MNRYALEYEMKLKGVSIKEMCKVLGISRSAFYRKCRGISEFTQGEIKKMIDYLKLDNPMDIFFTDRVS